MHLLDDVTDPAEAVEIAITRVRESLVSPATPTASTRSAGSP